MLLAYNIGTKLAKLVLLVLPRHWCERIQRSHSDIKIYKYQTQQVISKPRMTLFEAVTSTILFDLALFGTNSWFINTFIRLFTKFQNSWDVPFRTPQQRETEILNFCSKLAIQTTPWIWSKPIEEYACLNDFFARKYQPKYYIKDDDDDTVDKASSTIKVSSPACCIVTIYKNNDELRNILIKNCNYTIENIGLYPPHDIENYSNHQVMIGYLSPSHYHRVHVPISGKIIHLQLECPTAYSASVKFWNSTFNLLNCNKRLVVVIEQQQETTESEGGDGRARDQSIPLRVALVIVGGVGVNTIVYNKNVLHQQVTRGEEIATFRAGGSAFAMFSNRELHYNPRLLQHALVEDVIKGEGGSSMTSAGSGASNAQDDKLVELFVGESLS